jgi:glycosyltransferase involved in cell wall biosynthesis
MHSGVKFVVSPFYHGRGHTKLAQMLWTPYKPLAKRILRNADAIIVNSKGQTGLLRRDFSAQSRMYTVHDGVDVNRIKKAVPFEVDQSLKTLLYVGRLEKYKNIHVAISAVNQLPRNYHFYVIGTGPYRANLENLVRSFDLTGRVHFLGFQSDETVHRWMKTADAFLHLSSVESFGLTCIESLAAGTPVIANDDGLGLSETIELYPKYITKYKVGRDSSANLVRLIVDVACMKPVNADVSRFSWDFIADNVSKVYEEIL